MEDTLSCVCAVVGTMSLNVTYNPSVLCRDCCLKSHFFSFRNLIFIAFSRKYKIIVNIFSKHLTEKTVPNLWNFSSSY